MQDFTAPAFDFSRCAHAADYYVSIWSERNEQSAEQSANSWELLFRIDAQRIADLFLDGQTPTPEQVESYDRRKKAYYTEYREFRAWQEAGKLRANIAAAVSSCY